MKSIRIFSLLMASLLALSVVSPAAAAPLNSAHPNSGETEGLSRERAALLALSPPAMRPDGRDGIFRTIGQLTALGEDEFTLKTRRGEHTILVDEDTIFETRAGEQIGFEDLAVGRWVAVSVVRHEDDNPVARRVVLLPEDIDPARIPGRKMGGKVVEVSSAAETFTLQTRGGDELPLHVNEDTHYFGAVQGFSDLEEGMLAAVSVKEIEGVLTALVVAARPPADFSGQRYGGLVVSVDAPGRSFSLENRQGEEMTFSVDENTKFRSRNGEIQGLDDLEERMAVLVGAIEQDDGGLLAVVVLAAERRFLRGERALGEVVSVIPGQDEFSVQKRDGEELTFTVTGETRFLSRGGAVDELKDLKKGMIVGVKYETLEDGSLLAHAVAVLRVPAPGN